MKRIRRLLPPLLANLNDMRNPVPVVANPLGCKELLDLEELTPFDRSHHAAEVDAITQLPLAREEPLLAVHGVPCSVHLSHGVLEELAVRGPKRLAFYAA